MQENEHNTKGHLHPFTILSRKSIDILTKLGFEVASGPELESEEYNFDKLNVPKDHPSRDMQDTFWIKGRPDHVLRTHTSPVQVRYMLENDPPLKAITIGRVYRNEATDATHEAQFYQLEGLSVAEGVTLADLKATLKYFFGELFGNDTEVRFRPSFFPFVEPGVEVDVRCFKCVGAGCGLCKHTGWIEIMGAGMVHPNVLEASGVDSSKYTGFAFGAGFDRIASSIFQVPDIRLFYSADLRFINQF
ncbi:MAG: phenylalanine--tRNA ligase subunit alpha [Candidatus Campbellbacteria bacterium]|nr:phenylalanine--tRNA ligase subunit alpha [Candidatus Campbellbacteria bacterium]